MACVEVTPEIITDFRTFFPEFSDETDWPDDIVSAALCQGFAAVSNGCTWGTFTIGDCCSRARTGAYNYAAHMLTIKYGSSAADTSNPNTGQVSKVASKSVGDESISYSIRTPTSSGEEFYNSTFYGQQFWILSRQACWAYAG